MSTPDPMETVASTPDDRPCEPVDTAPSVSTSAEEDLKNQLLRLAADFDNYRKRAQRELEQTRRFGIERLLGDLLPVLDAVDRALGYVGDSREPFAEGVRLIARQAVDVLARHGVKGFASVGQPFDPTLHEAVGVNYTQGAPPGIVLEEHQRGYLLHDRLLRPAKVIVSAASRGPEPAPE